MERIAEFTKVDSNLFTDEAINCFGIDRRTAEEAYNDIILPKRATKGSAGYDFFIAVDLTIKPGETVKIPTGIRSRMEDGWVLMIFPRSGLGFKYRMMLDNTVGVIDSDYYYSDNEGHIMIKVTNCSGIGNSEGKTIELKKGQGFAQGVFLPFGITADDEAEGIRNGGFGSTTEKN
ncbi:MAG: deoxyuridine 5'-triphosphate nucleotidohydrolase [Lachnospiraceae bacterium]|nr:deoxyuridine 5'-triphosphate nucleotidohydrolase [Lachnospiraceae bacterium]